jgi:catechol 2,3-dioxygenase-like lactoylglutathione lyase family enzyme
VESRSVPTVEGETVKISSTQLWVHDQNVALAWYTERLGMEVRSDVTMPEMGGFRWLTVGPVGQPDIEIVLMAIPGAPMLDDATGAAVRDLTGKGMTGTVFLSTDDVHKEYAELTARGVEFVDAPMEMPYGIDSSFRDPSGNQFRLTQRIELFR